MFVSITKKYDDRGRAGQHLPPRLPGVAIANKGAVFAELRLFSRTREDGGVVMSLLKVFYKRSKRKKGLQTSRRRRLQVKKPIKPAS